MSGDIIHDTAIKAWIQTVTGFDSQHVINGNQSGPKPDTDFAVFTCLNESSDYHSTVIPHSPDPNPSLISRWKVVRRIYPVYQIDIFASTGKTLLNNLWDSRTIPPIRSALKDSGLSLSQRSIIRNVTALEVTRFSPRYNMDVTFLGETVFDPETALGWVNERWAAFDIRGQWVNGNDDLSVIITDEQEY